MKYGFLIFFGGFMGKNILVSVRFDESSSEYVYINSLRPGLRSEMVRKALAFYINQNGHLDPVQTPQQSSVIQVNKEHVYKEHEQKIENQFLDVKQIDPEPKISELCVTNDMLHKNEDSGSEVDSRMKGLLAEW